MLDVLVIGGIFREVLRYRNDREPDIRLAGSALTAAIVAARLGASVAIGSFVGSEDVRNVELLLEHSSVTSAIVTLEGASGTFAYEDAAATNPRPQYRPAETCPTALPPLPEARVLLVFGVPDFDPVRDKSVSRAAAAANVLVWDRQGWLSRTRDARAACVLKTPTRVLLINAAEAADEHILDLQSGIVTLPIGYDRCVVKDGVRGVLVIENIGDRRESIVPAYPVNPASTVGSGDLFGGAVAARLAAGDDLVEAARYAAAATSIVLASGETFAPPDLTQLVRKVLREGESRLDR